MKPTTALWILAPLSLAALAAALQVSRAAEARAGANVVWDEQEMDFVRHMVADTYVDELDETQSREAFHAAIEGYLRSLPDEYNHFISPDEYRRWLEDTAGRYAGVGVKVDPKAKEGFELVGVFPGGPADQAGLRVGEVVTHVDGRPLVGPDVPREQNLKVLKGPAGSTVVVTVLTPLPPDAPAGARPGVRTVTVVRGVISPPTVFARRLGDRGQVGYLRITEFVEATGADVDRELDAMVADDVKAVVVDLRGNGGGVLPATVHLADRFVREGVIVQMTGRARGARRVEVAKAEGTIPDSVRLVVLVDGHSASASEVFAGCIQDHRRGVLLGTRTFGKFLVQNITEIPGRDAAVKITTARYRTPNGRSYQRTNKDPGSAPAGLIPDVVVELSAEDRARLEKAWRNQEDRTWGAAPTHADVPPDWVDPQLRKALDLIAGDVLLQEIRPEAPRTGKNG